MFTMQSQARQFVKRQLDLARSWLTSEENIAKSQNQGDDSLNLVSNFESLLVEFQTLLIWSNPLNSALALTMFTCLYW